MKNVILSIYFLAIFVVICFFSIVLLKIREKFLIKKQVKECKEKEGQGRGVPKSIIKGQQEKIKSAYFKKIDNNTWWLNLFKDLLPYFLTTIGLVISVYGYLYQDNLNRKIYRPVLGLYDFNNNIIESNILSTSTPLYFGAHVSIPIKNYGNLPAYYQVDSSDINIGNQLKPYQTSSDYLMPGQEKELVFDLLFDSNRPTHCSIIEDNKIKITYGVDKNDLKYYLNISSTLIDSPVKDINTFVYVVRCGDNDKKTHQILVWEIDESK